MLTDAIETFLYAGRQGGWSKATVDQYRFHLVRLTDWLAERDVTTFEGLTGRLLVEYGALARDKWSPNTCKVSTIAIRSFLKHAFDNGLCSSELGTILKVPRVKPRMQRTVSADEVATMLETCLIPFASGLSPGQNYAVILRNQAILVMLFDTLLRSSELCRLRVDDVDLARRTVFVKQGKGGKDGVVCFSETAATFLQAWLKLRPFYAAATCDKVFCGITGNTPGQTLTTSGLRHIVQNICERSGVRHATPHAFRRGGAVQAVRNGAPTRLVMEWGRWEHLEMLETYTRALTAGDLFDAYAPMNGLS